MVNDKKNCTKFFKKHFYTFNIALKLPVLEIDRRKLVRIAVGVRRRPFVAELDVNLGRELLPEFIAVIFQLFLFRGWFLWLAGV